MRRILATLSFSLFALLMLISLACNLPLIANTGTNPTETFTLQPSQTFTGLFTITPEQPTITSSSTTTPIPPTETSTSTSTIVPPTVTATEPIIPCNRAEFVSDVNYPDGSNVFIDADFTKTWRLKNTGSCSWTSGYRIIFESGDKMGATDETVLTSGSIPPGATADISVPLKAPSTEGNYRGYFRLRSPDSVVFGINGDANDAFWVDINAIQLKIYKPIFPIYKFPTATPTLKFIIPPISITLIPIFP